MSNDYFFLEYARMRGKEIECEFNGVQAPKAARPDGLNIWCGNLLIQLGGRLVRLGLSLKWYGSRTIIPHCGRNRSCHP